MDAMTFQKEIQQIKKLLFRIAWSYMKNIQDVEDVVQDAIGIAWEKKDTLRDESYSGPGWQESYVTNANRFCEEETSSVSFH